MGLSSEFLKRYEFDWEVLEVVIGGRSAIDSGSRLRLRNSEDAIRFMECYGYDVDNPIEKAELFGNFQESLSFIRRFFLQPENPDGLRIEIPRKITELTDISQLLLLASAQSEGNTAQGIAALWACAIIKIMHTIAHIDKDLRTNYFPDVQKQILDRFYKFILRDDDGQIALGKDARDPDLVPLVQFESKPKKSRDSVILKLLHKPENVAEDIFDRVGIRFVTKNKFDAIRVARFLKERYVIMPANIKPSRSRNTLIDTKNFSAELGRLLKEVEAGRVTPGDFDMRLAEFCETPAGSPLAKESENPHSSKDFRTMQFTGRQLVKVKNPLYDELKAIKSAMKDFSVPDTIAKIVEGLDLRNVQKEIRFFYPFEVQIFDEENYQENQAGRSSHSNYKRSQIQAAMKRVLGELTRFTNNAPA